MIHNSIKPGFLPSLKRIKYTPIEIDFNSESLYEVSFFCEINEIDRKLLCSEPDEWGMS